MCISVLVRVQAVRATSYRLGESRKGTALKGRQLGSIRKLLFSHISKRQSRFGMALELILATFFASGQPLCGEARERDQQY